MIDVWILDKNFQTVPVVIESYISFIWSERFNRYGDFELYLPAGVYDMSNFKIGYYVWHKTSKNLNIIETIKVETSVEDGDFITITGRSLESILSRRIIRKETTIKGNLQDGIERLLNENAINPSDQNRKFSNLVFSKNNDSKITALTMDNQYNGDNLYEVIAELTKTKKVGFKVEFRESDHKFVFSLYFGTNRSYSQDKVPWVVFSDDFNNIITSTYTESTLEYINSVIVTGEDGNGDPMSIEVGHYKDLDRYETLIESTIQRTYYEDDNQVTMTASEYDKKLRELADKELKEYKKKTELASKVDYSHTFEFGIYRDTRNMIVQAKEVMARS